MYKFQKSAIAAGMTLLGANTNAATTSFINNVNSYLDASSSINGQFDINNFISSENTSGNEVTLNSATMTVYGFSSEASTAPTRTYTGSYTFSVPYTYSYSYSCGWSTCYGTATGYRTATGTSYNEYIGDGETDTVLLDFGDQQLSADTNNPDTYAGYYSGYYTRITRFDREEWGDVESFSALSAASLDDLLTDGILNYLITVSAGHFNSLSIKLDIDYSTSPLISSVPIPPALWLFGSALLGGRFLRRKKAN